MNKSNNQKTSRILTIIFMLLPAILIYGIYNVFGLVRTFYFSLFDWNGVGPANKSPYIGLLNFSQLMRDRYFLRAIGNNALLVVSSVVFQLGFGMILALIINAKITGAKFFRSVYFVPMLLSTVATGILWQLMLDPYTGLFQPLLHFLLPNTAGASWLGTEEIVMFSVIFVICWQYTPQYMILLSAGMTSIPDIIYEAATIDGASKTQQFFKITLPMLAPTMKTSAVLSIVGSLKYFDLVYVMTGGGPNGYSELMATYMYKNAFNNEKMGYASSISVTMVLISLVVVAIFFGLTKREKESSYY